MKRRLKQHLKNALMVLPPVRRYLSEKYTLDALWKEAAAERDTLALDVQQRRAAIETLSGERDALAQSCSRLAAETEWRSRTNKAIAAERDTLAGLRDQLQREVDQQRADLQAIVAERDFLRASQRRLSKKRIVFHIGLEKTGTTSLQTFLSKNHEMLRERGVFYPKNNSGFARVQHLALAASYLPKEARSFYTLDAEMTKDSVVASIHHEIEHAAAPMTVISSEFLSSRFGEKEIAELAQDFSAYDCQVLAVVRPHMERLISAYSSAVQSGSRRSFGQFVQNMFEPEVDPLFRDAHFRYPRFEQTLSCWEKYFSGRLTVLDYHSSTDVVPLIIRAIAPHVDVGNEARERSNTSLPIRLLELTRIANSLFPTYGELVASGKRDLWDETCKQRAATTSFMQSTVTIGAPDILCDVFSLMSLSEETRSQLSDVIATDTAWLREKHGLKLGSAWPPQ
jgi:hypothetical protein